MIAKVGEHNSNNYSLYIYIGDISTVNGIYKPTYSWGAPLCIVFGGFNPSAKYEFVSWDEYSHCMENKTCSTPPSNM